METKLFYISSDSQLPVFYQDLSNIQNKKRSSYNAYIDVTYKDLCNWKLSRKNVFFLSAVFICYGSFLTVIRNTICVLTTNKHLLFKQILLIHPL